MTDYTIVRDYWDRPFVTTDGGPLQYVKGRKTPVNAEPYTRISTMAGALDDKGGLIDWTAARAVIGLVKEDLEARKRDQDGAIFSGIANLMSNHADPWEVPWAKKPLKELVEKAKKRGGTEDAADVGTAFHGLTEVLDRTMEPPEYIPRHLEPWLHAYRTATEDFQPVLIEPFVVCDPIKTAGSPDRYYFHEKSGKVYAADIKSGSNEPEYPLKVTVQVAIASRAMLYDQATGKRRTIRCDQERGILVHAPVKHDTPHVDLYWLDLTKGWELAQLAYTVREKRSLPKLVKVA